MKRFSTAAMVIILAVSAQACSSGGNMPAASPSPAPSVQPSTSAPGVAGSPPPASAQPSSAPQEQIPTRDQAVQTALNAVQGGSAAPNVIFLPRGQDTYWDGTPRTDAVWEVTVTGSDTSKPLAVVYVDAITGKVVKIRNMGA